MYSWNWNSDSDSELYAAELNQEMQQNIWTQIIIQIHLQIKLQINSRNRTNLCTCKSLEYGFINLDLDRETNSQIRILSFTYAYKQIMILMQTALSKEIQIQHKDTIKIEIH